jgi:ATP-dependent protease ClpP protease subunit
MKWSKTIFAASSSGSDYIIDVFDFIGEDFWGEGVTPKSIARAISAAKAANATRIIVRINSPGGDVFDGNTIVSLFKSCGIKVRCEIHGLAASMASIIACAAGSEVVMAEGSMMMIHNPRSWSVGEAKDHRKTADLLDKVKVNLLGHYTAKSHLSKEEISAMCDATTWMTPLEAVANGLADSIMPNDAKAAAALPTDRAYAILSHYEKLPEEVLNRFKGSDGLRLVASLSEPKGRKTMDETTRQLLIARYGLASDSTDAQILAAVAKDAPSPTAAEAVPRADLDALRAENARLRQEKIDEAAKAAKDRQDTFALLVDTAVNQACADGKITPAGKAYHVKTCLAGGVQALKDFQEYTASQPKIVSNTQMEDAEAKRGAGDPKTFASAEGEDDVCKIMGVTKEEMAKARDDIRKNPDHYPPEAYRFAT